MKILGIDPSLTGTGLAVMEKIDGKIVCSKAIVIKTFPTELRWMRHERMLSIVKTIEEFIKNYGITMVSIEGFSLGSSGRATADLPELGGIIRKTILDFGLEFIEIPPPVLKKRITGKGNCYDKDKIIEGVNSTLGLSIEKNEVNHNAADAIGLGLMLIELLDANNGDIAAMRIAMAVAEIKKNSKKKKNAKKNKKIIPPGEKEITEVI